MPRRRKNGQSSRQPVTRFGDRSKNGSKNRRRTMNSERSIQLTISRDNVVSQVAAFLVAIGVIRDNEEIVDIKFGDVSKELVPITICFKEA